MKQHLNRILAALLCIMVFYGISNAENLKREVRSVWLTTVWGIDWPSTQGTGSAIQKKQKDQMIKYLDELKANNMTSVCFQVRSMNDAMYKSKYCPWSSFLSGTRGKDPGWDPLVFVIEECHKRGLECYAWLNPYRHSTGSDWNTKQDQELKNGGWLLDYTHTDSKGNKSYKCILNPGLDKCRQRIVDVCKEIVVGYAVDGIVFDDYFYPDFIPENSTAGDYQLWKNSGTTMKIGDWRRDNVNKMVKGVYDMIQANRPDVRFGISPAGVACTSSSVAAGHGVNRCPVASDWQYNQIYSDPVAWVKEGTVDFISPQIYWFTTNGYSPYGPIAEWWSYVANKFSRHFYSSHSVSVLKDNNTLSNWQDFDKQIQMNRDYTENNAPGSIFYSARNIVRGINSNDLSNHLKTTKFTQKVLHPVITWKKAKNLGKVINLALNGGKLTWNAVVDGKSNIRYTIYAVPQTVTMEQAKRTDGDGIKAEYLLDMWYGTSYTLPSNKKGNFWYAVCVYDGYSNEYEPAIVNNSQATSEQVVLTSPVNGVKTSWEQKFLWSNVAGASYRLQIASDSGFSNIIYNETGVATNSLVLDLCKLNDSQKYYWRVYCAEPGKLESVSAVAVFTAPAKTPGKAATLIAPVDGVKVDDDFTFTWNAAGDIDEIQISESRDFSKIKYTGKVTRTSPTSSFRMSVSFLGKGIFYWRVRSTYKHYSDAYSAVRSFNVTRIVTGETEKGYVIKTDDGTYSDMDNIIIENVWFRSVRKGYVNHPVETSGSQTRAMNVKNGIVYLTNRSENSASADIWLTKINGASGEVLGNLVLSNEGKIPYFPNNDIVKDSKGTLCVANMVLNSKTNEVKLFAVDVETGKLTEKASVNTPEKARIDHVAIYGDVNGGDFWLFAPASSSNVVYRWSFSNGKLLKTEQSTLASLYPAKAANMGIAPRIIPVDENKIFIDGGATYFTLYEFSSGRMIDSFANNSAICPKGLSASGGAHFKIGYNQYVVYPFEDNTGANGYQFAVSKTDDKFSFRNMKQLWVFPEYGLGSFNSSTVQASAACESVSMNIENIYIYVPGDGVACYRLTDKNFTGACNTVKTDNFTVVIAGKNLIFSEKADKAVVYTTTGAVVAFAEDVQNMQLDLEAGVYIVNAVSGDKTLKQVVVIR